MYVIVRFVVLMAILGMFGVATVKALVYGLILALLCAGAASLMSGEIRKHTNPHPRKPPSFHTDRGYNFWRGRN